MKFSTKEKTTSVIRMDLAHSAIFLEYPSKLKKFRKQRFSKLCLISNQRVEKSEKYAIFGEILIFLQLPLSKFYVKKSDQLFSHSLEISKFWRIKRRFVQKIS
jgi:hypothetical protein